MIGMDSKLVTKKQRNPLREGEALVEESHSSQQAKGPHMIKHSWQGPHI